MNPGNEEQKPRFSAKVYRQIFGRRIGLPVIGILAGIVLSFIQFWYLSLVLVIVGIASLISVSRSKGKIDFLDDKIRFSKRDGSVREIEYYDLVSCDFLKSKYGFRPSATIIEIRIRSSIGGAKDETLQFLDPTPNEGGDDKDCMTWLTKKIEAEEGKSLK